MQFDKFTLKSQEAIKTAQKLAQDRPSRNPSRASGKSDYNAAGRHCCPGPKNWGLIRRWF